MLSRQHMHVELEMLKWLAVIALAAAIALAWVSRAAGSEASGRPELLPPEVAQLAEPMPNVGEPETVESQLDWTNNCNERLWAILNFHRHGDIESAIGAWDDVTLPCEMEVWRHVALGAAYLQAGDLDRAAEEIAMADDHSPYNAVVHYFAGILRMQQASNASEWLDVEPGKFQRLVSHVPRQVAPNTKSMYELAAMVELQKALELAPLLPRNEILIPPPSDDVEAYSLSSMPAMVGDVLDAIGADNFEGKSHNMLSYLFLDRGWLNQAEEHMDMAVETGMSVPYGYQDLGKRYEAEERHLDAARSYLKHLAQDGTSKVGPATDCLENIRKAFRGLF